MQKDRIEHAVQEPAPPRGTWHAVVAFVVALTVARLVYLGFFCPFTLIEDEAFYWDWSRRLDWSYYTKGPGIAWTILASVEALGKSEFAVRLPAVLASAAACLLMARLAVDVARTWKAALASVLLFQATPLFLALGFIMNIDGPYAACWLAACLGLWHAVGPPHPSRRPVMGLALAGAAVGVGVLYKYTILLLPASALVYAVLWRRDIDWKRTAPGILAGLVLMLLASAPVFIWNAREGWPTVSHLMGHLGLKGGDEPVRQGAGKGWAYEIDWTLSYLGAQAALMGPVLMLMIAATIKAWRERRRDADRWRRQSFLLCLGMPLLVFYLFVSFLTEPEGNWPLAGYLTLLVLAGWSASEVVPRWREQVRTWRALPRPRPWMGGIHPWPFSWHAAGWYAALGLGVIVALGLPRLDLVAKLPMVGSLVPLGRFTGADRVEAHVREIEAMVRAETGQEPFVLAYHYGRTAQLVFYATTNDADVYCAGSLMGTRVNQYDFWSDTDLRRVTPELLGRPAVLVGAGVDQWAPAFERVVEVTRLRGDRPHGRPAAIGYNYRGFPGASPPRSPEPKR